MTEDFQNALTLNSMFLEVLESRLFNVSQLVFTVSESFSTKEEAAIYGDALKPIGLMLMGLAEECGQHKMDFEREVGALK